MTFRRGRDQEGFQNYGERASHRLSQLPSSPGATIITVKRPWTQHNIQYLVQCSAFTPQILRSTISNVFVAGSILKCDFHKGSDSDTISFRFWIHIDEVRLDLRHG